ncbi:hypothetical protein BKA65DRAFT_481616 [Rhexocercosporidium sp. MPI-PUGE-AT-0058]|nr:hypothetical protein BKA65DRAFT_481616 [Rhexocercosporidium sp. MPI-PUGE-AT-0058]
MTSPHKTVITGCSTGDLGSALLEAFLKKNFHVFATLRNHSKTPYYLISLSGVTIITLDDLSSTSIPSAIEGGPERIASEDSYYAKVGKDICDLGDGGLAEHAISSEAWATKVVAAVEKGSNGKFWCGDAASAISWGTWLFPGWLLLSWCLEKVFEMSAEQ